MFVCVSSDRTNGNLCVNPHRERIVACTRRGGARLLSRGAEGVTGCSGEGLHPLCHRSFHVCFCAFPVGINYESLHESMV